MLAAVASANGCINDAARAWFSLGRDRYLPTWFSAVHPKYRTPYRSIMFLLPIALAFAFIADLNQAITFSILSGVLQYTFMSINIVMFRNKWPLGSIRRGYTHPFHPLPAIVLFVLCVVTYLRDLPRLRLAAHRDGGVLHRHVAVVPFLPLPLCAARRPVHDALAEAEGLLSAFPRHAMARASGPSVFELTMDRQTVIGTLAAGALAALLAWRYSRAEAARRDAPRKFYEEVLEVLEEAEIAGTDGAGIPKLTGRYNGHAVQILPVADTLATRRLPALWLMVTLQTPLPLAAKFDMMMRPAGHTTFSNFDLLPVTINHPPGFPDHAVVRTDNEATLLPPHVVLPHLGLFADHRAKELLVAPNGLRIVWLLAEADRARYGVFRQADFGEAALDPALATGLLDRLIALRLAILDWHGTRT